MELKPVRVEVSAFPAAFHELLAGGRLYDSSCSPEARVIFVDEDGGYFLKSAPKGRLEREATMTRYFHGKGLAARVLDYVSDAQDWLLTEKIHGEDCAMPRYLEQPEKLCEVLAERLAALHSLKFADCPIQDHTRRYLAGVEENRRTRTYDESTDAAWATVEAGRHLLETNTLLHGDYCLPNVILKDWQFAGFIDLDGAGVGDRHVDLYWAIWSLQYNLGTDAYRRRFLDAYGRGRVDEERLRVVAAVEVFG